MKSRFFYDATQVDIFLDAQNRCDNFGLKRIKRDRTFDPSCEKLNTLSPLFVSFKVTR